MLPGPSANWVRISSTPGRRRSGPCSAQPQDAQVDHVRRRGGPVQRSRARGADPWWGGGAYPIRSREVVFVIVPNAGIESLPPAAELQAFAVRPRRPARPPHHHPRRYLRLPVVPGRRPSTRSPSRDGTPGSDSLTHRGNIVAPADDASARGHRPFTSRPGSIRGPLQGRERPGEARPTGARDAPKNDSSQASTATMARFTSDRPSGVTESDHARPSPGWGDRLDEAPLLQRPHHL